MDVSLFFFTEILAVKNYILLSSKYPKNLLGDNATHEIKHPEFNTV